MNSGISADLTALEESYHRLAALAEDIEDKMLCIRQEYNTISYMSLDEAEEELLHTIHRLSQIYDDILRRAKALKRICELYEECEQNICHMVDDLPCNISSADNGAGALFGYGPDVIINGAGYRLGEYSSGYFVSDDWLSELIF